MICATRDIILFNKRLDTTEMKNVYVPVQISGVSVYDNRQSSKEGGYHAQSDDFKIRIPLNAIVQDKREYIPETEYDRLPDYEISGKWTIHTEDMIILYEKSFSDVSTRVFTLESKFPGADDVEKIAADIGSPRDVIHITSYSDNTLRGSGRVRHWRIGGA